MKKNFLIDPKNNGGESFVVTAETYEAAAQIAVRRLFGRRRGMVAIRTTGNTNMSGIFNAYLPCKTGGQSSHGNNFHVMESRF